MTELTPKGLARKIMKLPATRPITGDYERSLLSSIVSKSDGVWYKSQKEHWLGWLTEYDGSGAHNRKTQRGRSAQFDLQLILPAAVHSGRLHVFSL